MVNIELTGDQDLRNLYAFQLLTTPPFVEKVLPRGVSIYLDIYRQMGYNYRGSDRYTDNRIDLPYGISGDLKEGLPDSLDMYSFWVNVVGKYIDQSTNHYEKINKRELLSSHQQLIVFKYPHMCGDYSPAGHWFLNDGISVLDYSQGIFSIPNQQEHLLLRLVERAYRIPNISTLLGGLTGIHEEPKTTWITEIQNRWRDILNESDFNKREQILNTIANAIPGIGPITIRKTSGLVGSELDFWLNDSV